jgi:hypothetical protein
MQLNELKPFFGTRVLLVLNSGARYSGVMYRWNDNTIVLSRLCIINRAGGVYAPKYRNTRRFNVAKIKTVEKDQYIYLDLRLDHETV